ncbi:DUF2509 family protein [Zophobihabitans entericus]|uniref:YgdB family protein n=1 Tax=Zophobihabitans entericus TaxID=1635327 RepID=A0A6G9IBV9_9GAMM|nr:DUF2509 family protein [Zophobihabitans entericus]QIQ21715.1 YgdB family protein [Zophobihabitans entericus]
MKIVYYPDNCDQQGFSAIALVLVLLLLGMLLLTGFYQSLFIWQKSDVYERRYFRSYNQASSGLVWGKLQSWNTPTESWQCQKELSLKLDVCVKQASFGGMIILKSIGQDLVLYHLAYYDSVTQKLVSESGHWLDFCPERVGYDCE